MIFPIVFFKQRLRMTMEIKSHKLEKQIPPTERYAIQHHSHHLVVTVGGISILRRVR